jgi:hypothetical protein
VPGFMGLISKNFRAETENRTIDYDKFEEMTKIYMKESGIPA